MNLFVGIVLGLLLGKKWPGFGLPQPQPGGGGLPFPKDVPGSPGGLPGGMPWPNIPAGWQIPQVQPQPQPQGTDQPQPQPQQQKPAPVTTYTIKSGDYASGLAQKKTGNAGRWRELLASNPEMTTYTDSKGQTQIKPWQVGQVIVLPPGWV